MGAVFWAKVGEFIAAIFIGTASTNAAYVLAVNLARVAVLALIAKVTAPKLGLSQKAVEKLLTLRDPIAPQTFMYGEDMISGPLLFSNVNIGDGKDLIMVVALLGHECDSVISYRIDDTNVGAINDEAINAIVSGKFSGVASVEFRFGTSSQAVFALLTAQHANLFGVNHTGRGWTMMTWKFSIVEGLEEAFEDGVPQNLKAVIRGKRVYDPRRYSLNTDNHFMGACTDLDSGRTFWFGDNAQTTSIDAAFTCAGPSGGGGNGRQPAGRQPTGRQPTGRQPGSGGGSGPIDTLSLTDNDAATEDIFSERFPVDILKLYTAQARVRQTSGDRVNILGVAFYDSGGSLITPGAETGWANLGANYFEFFASAVFPATYTIQSQEFGTSGGQIPAGAVTMALVGQFCGAGTTNTTVDIKDMSIFENTLVARHTLADDSIWEWSDNPAICLADFIRWDKFGMREVDERIDWPQVIIAAQICDEKVAIPGGGSPTQKRYTLNAVFSSIETRLDVRDQILGAMMGRMVFSQGLWRMWAGAAIVPDVTLTEANLGGAIQLQASAGAKERYNRVRGKFIDAGRDYTANSYAEQRSAVFVADDGGEVTEIVADMLHTNNRFEAQRKAIIFLKQSRNQRLVVFQGNYSCFRIQPPGSRFWGPM